MPIITVLPISRKIQAGSGTVLLNAIRNAGIEISAPCDGQGICGKCKVRIAHPAPPLKPPQPHLTTEEIDSGVRLACRVKIRQAMTVFLPDDHSLDARILEGDLILKSRIAPAATIEQANGQYRLLYRDQPAMTLTSWRPSFAPKGIAVDLGTTTISLALMDLESGRRLATASTVNSQTRFGHDVMTRIQRASTREGLDVLAALVTADLNGLVAKACKDSGAHPHEIVDAVIGGNATMLQLAAAIDPTPLGRAPFRVGLSGGHTCPAEQFRLHINPRARIYLPPVAHAFVGADISAGLLSIDFFNRKSPTLFIDMGTNGEIALAAHGKMLVTSTATGPAFEGLGITHGMRAAEGAIETVWASGDHLCLRTVNKAPAKGICGSGIMDIMACLIRLRAIEPGGRLLRPQQSDTFQGPLAGRFMQVDGMDAIRLADNVYFTQKDIRQFQLAKSAVQTGIEMLLCASQVRVEQLEKMIIAGAFGYHLRKESLRRIGIIPRGFRGDVAFAGNTCQTGCALMLLDAARRDDLEAKMERVAHLSIAAAPDFQSRFIENINLVPLRTEAPRKQ